MHIIVTLLFLFFLFPPALSADEADNIQAVKAMIETINQRNLQALDELVAADVVRHSASTPGVSVTSLDEFRAFLEGDLATVPDSVQTIEIIFGSGDYVAIRAKYSGTQSGPMGPFPASGKRVEIPFMGILRFEQGKIAEIWVEWDNLNILSALGHYPPE